MTIQKRNSLAAKTALLFASTGVIGNLSVASTAFADEIVKVSAGDFDLTKQATEATFPVMFDRPSGVNAAALAGAVRNLGTDSDLYKKAVAAVPELANASKMASLLNDAMSTDAATKSEARATIVKLINWYNSLGGTKITTQAGAAYTAANLDEPINVLAVAFSNSDSINAKVSNTIDKSFASVKTVKDVMNIFDGYQVGTSTGYQNAFNAYAAKVYANGADITALSSYANVKPVLDAYEKMYVDGGAAIRKQLLDGEAASTEAAVAFFESAIITGKVANSDGGSSNSNTVPETKVKTRWVDESGKALAPEETDTNYKGQKSFDGYTFKEVTTKDGVRTYVYTPVKPAVTSDTKWVDESGKELKPMVSGEFPDHEGDDVPGYTLISTKTNKDSNGNTHVVNTYHKVIEDTVWVDEAGKVLKEKTSGTFPDTDGTSDIPGYTLVKYTTKTEENGDKHTVNTYKKVEDVAKPDTYWFDDNGDQLKEPALDQTLPDNEGDDIPGYERISIYTVTADDAKGDFGKSGFGEGDVINIYKKKTTPTPTPEVKKTTKWVDEQGNKLKDEVEGSFPDKDGNDIPGYTLVTIKDDNGNITNIYKKDEKPADKVTTKWIEKSTGKNLKDEKEGSFPDTEGDDVPGYVLIDRTVDNKGNVVNYYEKLTTRWVENSTGKDLKDKTDGTFPDNEGDDIKGYTMVGKPSVDEKGHVINYYEKTPEPKPTPEPKAKLITHYVDEKGNLLLEDVVGEEFAKVKKIDGYELTREYQKDEDEYVYVYKKVETPKPAAPAETPKAETPKASLPKTGDAGSLLSVLGGVSLAGVGAKLGFSKKRNKKR